MSVDENSDQYALLCWKVTQTLCRSKLDTHRCVENILDLDLI